MAYYLFNFVKEGAAKRRALEQAAEFLYLGAPEREFIGRAELASAVHEWTPSEARVYPGDSPGGVLLAQVEEWDPPVPMNAVLSQIVPAGNAKAEFQTGVVRITANEYETALAVAARRLPSTG